MTTLCADGRRLAIAVTLVCGLNAAGAAQTRPADFKTLYADAAYDEALAQLGPLRTTEAYQYKALCLLALGRHQEAKEATQALVTASPTFVPSSEEVPPRFIQLVAEVRRAMLPTLARRAFADGRERFNAKAVDDAIRQFNLVLTLVSDPAFGDATTAQDLKTLAQGFIDLARASTPPPAPAVVSKPVEPEPLPPVSAPTVVQAVPIVQTVPPLPSEATGRLGAVLTINVLIDANGNVTSASVRQSAHPVYDRLVLQAARGWRYAPATLNGRPIPSEKTVSIQTGAR